MVKPSPEAAIFIMIAIGTNSDRQQAQQGQPSSAAAEYGRAHESRSMPAEPQTALATGRCGYTGIRHHYCSHLKVVMCGVPPLNRYI